MKDWQGSHHSIKQHPELYHTTVLGKKTLIHHPESNIAETSHQIETAFLELEISNTDPTYPVTPVIGPYLIDRIEIGVNGDPNLVQTLSSDWFVYPRANPIRPEDTGNDGKLVFSSISWRLTSKRNDLIETSHRSLLKQNHLKIPYMNVQSMTWSGRLRSGVMTERRNWVGHSQRYHNWISVSTSTIFSLTSSSIKYNGV
ncbi:hypothetical protein PPL_04790 [Heterostelium album PN500]|uniref:Uncharacterized protein n=1 Tax=Heterostelium pallidum (strain ATCC 26659 / Pp 5 / PN500) TaxID=670386 RepID=D3B8J7_HETP5|nr:hypothetical protein PPL_04790 [Heterostelium album PN500]EFA82365.1 hypothetical protein PPL_04790 [Heterostelium album PN500]|eukprot:XP_020434482.1 hypothetical protein PPL_04790 [Heterostelium album PN500]